jgi:tetratricopeptide (TPR) repeat protein
LRISLDRNETRSALVAYNNVATNVILTGRLVEGRDLIDQAIEYGSQRGYATGADWSRMTKCEALFPMGDWDATLTMAEQLIASDQARGGSQITAFARLWKATVLFHRGSTTQAKQLWTEAMEQVRKIEDAQGLFPALAGGIAIWEAAGEAAEARRMAHELAEISIDNPVFLATHLPVAAGAIVSLGMSEQLERLVRVAKPISDWMVAQVGGAKALVSETRGEHKEAYALYQSIIDAGLPRGQRFWVTGARIGVGRCLMALGRESKAAEELGVARSDAEAMGARRLLDLIDELEHGAEGVAVPGN